MSMFAYELKLPHSGGKIQVLELMEKKPEEFPYLVGYTDITGIYYPIKGIYPKMSPGYGDVDQTISALVTEDDGVITHVAISGFIKNNRLYISDITGNAKSVTFSSEVPPLLANH